MEVKLLLDAIPSAHGRREEHFYVPSTRRVQTDDGLNVFQIVYFRLAPLARTSVNREDDGTVARDRPVELICLLSHNLFLYLN